MTDAPARQLENKPLPELDALYPAVSFMEILDKRDGSKSVVGTRRDVRGLPHYVELPRPARITEVKLVALAAEIDSQLYKKIVKANTRSDGSVITRMVPSLPGGAMNRKQRRDLERTERRRIGRTVPMV